MMIMGVPLGVALRRGAFRDGNAEYGLEIAKRKPPPDVSLHEVN
jgi:hypothetical protein